MKSYINPLLWVHGEDETAIREELQQMHSKGIGQFIIEPRPHLEYLQEKWWHDCGVLIREAKALGMKVWFFDDGTYPSGTAYGQMAVKYPDRLKKYFAQNHIDAYGPLKDSSFYVGDWLDPEESLIAVIAARRTAVNEDIDSSTLTVITDKVVDGVLYWDVPEGLWRVFVIKETRNGGEDYTRNYCNPLDAYSVAGFIDLVYESHYAHFGNEFGNTIAGFFTDEPRFGNIASHHVRLGQEMVLPYCDGLMQRLSEEYGNDFIRVLPLLWYEDDGQAPDVRYAYMNVVSKLFSENFLGQMGKWCEQHNVRLIGHIVEDNGCHARLGFGVGHFFRAISGLHAGGLDIVANILPGHDGGNFYSLFDAHMNTDFNNWGIAKLASSSAHIDPKKKGTVVCEAFGAYGWHEGLKMMKWITDHICVRGVNVIIPHAFTLAPFPDPECPPHFYAQNNNPQWPYFDLWSNYTNRVCDLLSDAYPIIPAAVVYHAEGEWGGNYQPFELPNKNFLQHQIDCDVLPIDALVQATIENGELVVNNNHYRILVVPYMEFVPKELETAVNRFMVSGLPVVFCDKIPTRCYYSDRFNVNNPVIIETQNLYTVAPKDPIFENATFNSPANNLRYCHYRKNGTEIYFFTNESRDNAIQFSLKTNGLQMYNPMTDQYYAFDGTISLAPFESVFLLSENQATSALPKPIYVTKTEIQGPWAISINGQQCPFNTLGNISTPERLPKFSGKIRYEINIPGCNAIDLGRVYESVEVFINGKSIGRAICPPYQFEIPEEFADCNNTLVVEVTNTLVKSHHHPIFDRYVVQEPAGLIGPVKLLVKA